MRRFGTISLKGLTFFAHHGCLESERRDGNYFFVDIECKVRLREASVSDRLEASVDYSKIYDIIRQEMEVPSNLLENVAGRIARRICSELGEVRSGVLTVSKMNPPLDYPDPSLNGAACSSVTVKF